MQRQQTIITIIGGPGSGKGTQCQLLSDQLHYHHISTGELVRASIDSAEARHDTSELSRSIREATQSGKLLPDQLILDLLKTEMAKYPEVNGFLIDGCPRTMAQAKLFEDQIGKSSQTVYLNAPEDEMVKRLHHRSEIEHRADDSSESITRRLKSYNEQTKPVVDYLQSTSPESFTEVNALGDIKTINQTILAALNKNVAYDNNDISSVGLFELMKLYWTSGNFCDAVTELEQRYHANNFEITFAYLPVLYIMQSKEHVKTILNANTRTGFQNNNFDVAHGHPLNINATQAFNGPADMSHNPLWKNIHKGLIKNVGNRESVNKLIDKHIHTLFTRKTFTLDKTFERFLLEFWCEYLFGTNVNAGQFAKTREKLLGAMGYAFYGNTLKNTPVLGELTCRFYGWLKGNEFSAVDGELQQYLDEADSGLLYQLKQSLLDSDDFPPDQINQALVDNAFDLILVFDFLNNALYETLASIVKNKLSDDQQRRDSYAPGLRSAFLFPYRVRVPQQIIQLNDKTIEQGSYVFINLVKSGNYHSHGPRACVGTGVTQWVKDRVFDHLKDIELNLVKTTHPKDRGTLSHCADVPMSPERYEVSWNYPRNYLQDHLPSYPFKNIEHFYDILKAFEDPRLFGYAVASFVEIIEQLNLDHDKIVIVAPEVRGIPLAAAIARELDVKQVYIRKPGKIPGPVLAKQYQNAYASECLEISKNADLQGKHIIVIDDGIASGGTLKTCCDLVEELGGDIKSIFGMVNHRYKTKIAALDAYHDRIHTLFDFEADAKPSEKQMTAPGLLTTQHIRMTP